MNNLFCVTQFIKKQFDDLGWTVTLDEFDDDTPVGKRRFTNIIATLNPGARRRLLLAAHYDSKSMEPTVDGQYFLGTIDSAVPCAMLIEIARTLTPLFSRRQHRSQVTIIKSSSSSFNFPSFPLLRLEVI